MWRHGAATEQREIERSGEEPKGRKKRLTGGVVGGAAYKCREGEIGAEKRCREWNGERVRPIDFPVGPVGRTAWRSTAAAHNNLGREAGGFAAEKRRSGEVGCSQGRLGRENRALRMGMRAGPWAWV